MSSAVQNRLIARIIVGAMLADGDLDQREANRIVKTLAEIGMSELIADIGSAIESDMSNFNMFKDVTELVNSLGQDAKELSPMIFRLVCDVVVTDRFVTTSEAAYLAALGKRLEISIQGARDIFKQVLIDRGGRLEIGPSSVDESIHPNLKELLSFSGADKLVGELDENSLGSLAQNLKEKNPARADVTSEELEKALTILGLDHKAKLEDAKKVWRETIDNLHLPKMADLGETFVSAAIQRITRINDAYKNVLFFYESSKRTTSGGGKKSS